MIEAKGPGFDGVLSFPKGMANVTKDWLGQSRSELDASGPRRPDWYFAEASAADYARKLFAKEKGGRESIIVHFVPPVSP